MRIEKCEKTFDSKVLKRATKFHRKMAEENQFQQNKKDWLTRSEGRSDILWMEEPR